MPERLAVFLDCGFSDETFIRQEMTYVDYVRDRQVADVHVLVTQHASHYLHELERYSVRFSGSVDLRITQGLSIELGGNVALIPPSAQPSERRRRSARGAPPTPPARDELPGRAELRIPLSLRLDLQQHREHALRGRRRRRTRDRLFTSRFLAPALSGWRATESEAATRDASQGGAIPFHFPENGLKRAFSDATVSGVGEAWKLPFLLPGTLTHSVGEGTQTDRLEQQGTSTNPGGAL
jgi:hypothetical protein